jgi:hypothetical protein
MRIKQPRYSKLTRPLMLHGGQGRSKADLQAQAKGMIFGVILIGAFALVALLAKW